VTAFRQIVICCNAKDCNICTTVGGKSVKAARNALWLGGWTQHKKRDRCPLHNPKRDDVQGRRTSMEWKGQP